MSIDSCIGTLWYTTARLSGAIGDRPGDHWRADGFGRWDVPRAVRRTAGVA